MRLASRPVQPGYFTATVFKADYTCFFRISAHPQRQLSGPERPDLPESVQRGLWGVELAGEFRFHGTWTASASFAFIEGKQAVDAATRRVRCTDCYLGVCDSDRPNGFDAQLISTWAGDVLSRSSPLLSST